MLKRVVMSHQNLKVGNMLHSNQQILKAFFNTIIDIVSRGTSDTYASMVLTKFNKKNISDFPFIEYINLQKKEIEINKKINSINSKLVAVYITKLVNSIFSDLFRHLLKKKMSLELLKDFKKLGVKI